MVPKRGGGHLAIGTTQGSIRISQKKDILRDKWARACVVVSVEHTRQS